MPLVSGGTYRLTSYPRSGGSFINFSCERIAMSDVNVRQAIAYSFDKDAAVAAYVGDLGMRVDGYYGLGQWMLTVVEQGDPNSLDDEFLFDEDEDEGAELSMDVVPVYDPDPEAAEALLDESGWNLNPEGKSFKAGVDTVRCKAFDRSELEADGLLEAALDQGGVEMQLNGTDVVLLPLRLAMYYPEGNDIADCLDETLVAPLAEVGIVLELQAVPFQDLLQIYYRNVDRDCDLLYMATNFTTNFDLTYVFSTEEQYQRQYNTSGLIDEELYEAARDLIHTRPGDAETYCQKWINFQILYQEKVPGIFVYSNVYMDVYTYALNNYRIASNMTWSQAVLDAYLSDPLSE